MSSITLPTTGSAGTAAPFVQTDLITSEHVQRVKLVDATIGSSLSVGLDANPFVTRFTGANSFRSINIDFNSVQSGSVVWSAGVGKIINVTRCQVMAGSATAGLVTLFFARSGAPVQWTSGSGTFIFRGEMAPSTTVKPGAIIPFPTPSYGAVNDALRYSASAAVQVYVIVDAFED